MIPLSSALFLQRTSSSEAHRMASSFSCLPILHGTIWNPIIVTEPFYGSFPYCLEVSGLHFHILLSHPFLFLLNPFVFVPQNQYSISLQKYRSICNSPYKNVPIFCLILPIFNRFRNILNPDSLIRVRSTVCFFASSTAPALSFTPNFLYACAI